MGAGRGERVAEDNVAGTVAAGTDKQACMQAAIRICSGRLLRVGMARNEADGEGMLMRGSCS